MNPPKKQGRPRPETAERKRDILKAALETFGQKGYHNGPLTEIAEQVNMTHAGILHHFGSKQRLLVEVLRYRDVADVETVEGQHIPGGMELFRHLVRTAFLNEARPGIVQAYAVLSAESVTEGNPGREYFQHRYTTLRADVEAAFREVCAERGITEPASIASASAAILAVMDGLQVQWLLDRDNVELAESSRFAIDALVSAVLTPQASALGAHADA